MIFIEKDIEPPISALFKRPVKNQGVKSKYPFGDMVLGDSFFVFGMSEPELKAKARLFSKTKEGKGMQFATYPEGMGARCWLVGIDNED